jgi:hypothetical protein
MNIADPVSRRSVRQLQMNYNQRLLVLLATSVIMLPLYFVLMPRVLTNAQLPVVFPLPFVVIIIGGSVYLARGRRSDGAKAGYARSVLMAVLIAFSLPGLCYFSRRSFGS